MSGVDLSTLNEAQRTIAKTLDAPLFVEAGAGSGKTFTLTRRVAWALSPGSGKDGRPFLDDISQVLVITFTNAAAREIRERVRTSLRQAGMRDAALAVDSAWISTIHGMCQRILKRNALELGLDPAFGVCDSHRQEELLGVAVERTVGAARREASSDSLVARLFEEFGYPRVVSSVLSLVQCAHAAVDGFDSIALQGPGGVASAMSDLLRSYEAMGAAKGLSAAARNAIEPAVEALQAFDRLPPGSKTPSRAAVALESCKLPRSSKAIADLHPHAKAERSNALALVALEQVAEFGPLLLNLARNTDACYASIKRSQALLDNDDLITLALEAVRDEPQIAQRYAGRFRLVMVDEFQDTDAKQLKLISILAGGGDDPRHLATVGDAQQSIYRFRGADVAVFNARGRRVPSEGHVRLDVNYRSHADVLAFVDEVCGGGRGVLRDFMHLDDNPGREDGYHARELPRISVELASKQDRGVGAQALAVQLAEQVADRLARYRDAGERAGDMALLLGSTTRAGLYIDALRSRGIECVVTGGSTFTKAPEVGVMLSLLRTLANPRDTQSGLFPLLSSEMFELDANDFVQLGSRAQDNLDAPTKRTIERGLESLELYGDGVASGRLRRAHDVLARANQMLGTSSVADVCLYVVRASGWLSRLEGQGPQGAAVEANVLAAVRYIRDLTDELGLGPVRAADEFARWLEVSKVPPASLAGAEQDTVRVMTIHASKGLEYPVVAVAECWTNPKQEGGLWSAPNEDGSVQAVLVPKGGVDLGGVEDAMTTGSLVDTALRLKTVNSDADEQEKARLLYVALTRAREALVLAVNAGGSKKGISSTLARGVVDALFEGELPAEGEREQEFGGGRSMTVRHVALEPHGEDADEVLEDAVCRMVGLYEAEEAPSDEVTLMRAREGVFSYSSALAGSGADASSAAAPKAATTTETNAPRERRTLPPRERREAQEAGAADAQDADKATNLGSAFHMVAQTMVETGRDADPARVEALARRWNLSDRQRDRLQAAVENWTTSELRREALGYGLVRAEAPFFALSGGSEHGAYVEGAIDLLCTDGVACEGTALVVDYKTGDLGLSEEQVRARHAAQAELYSKVLLSMGFARVRCAFIAVETGVVARWDTEGPCQ